MRIERMAAILLCLAALPAAADPEDAHPLVGKPFPRIPGLTSLKPPFALLVARPSDGEALWALGEAKLLEFAGERPGIQVAALRVLGGQGGIGKTLDRGFIPTGQIPPSALVALKVPIPPAIVTVTPDGRVHRINTLDHWPTMTVAVPAFGPSAQPQKSQPWWRTLLDAWPWR